jgi:GTP-binding protein EngB required for normal cell division
MHQNRAIFNAAKIGEKFENALIRLEQLLEKDKNDELTTISQKLRHELNNYRKDGILSVAFIGQYSAGKSTIISALTGRRDIKIDADIATDRTTNYDWNSIKIIDTPGLFTERQDHDAITYQAINKADLLVFCLTYMLFDTITLENFKKLAYDKSYRWKMMLVINKMSDEAGEDEEKIANYRKSLSEALKPYQLDEFPVSFIDAKDYCEGVDGEDDFLIEMSHLPFFIAELNKFVEHRASLTHFDTPVRMVLSYVDEAQLSFTRNSTEDSAFFEILNQLSRKIRNERSRLKTKVESISLAMSSAIAQEGIIFAAELGRIKTKEELEKLNKQAEINVQKHYEKAEIEIGEIVRAAIDSIQREIQGVLKGNLVQAFLARVEAREEQSKWNNNFNFNEKSNFDENLKKQVEMLKKIGEKAGLGIRKLATDSATTVNQGFLSASNVAGSTLHHGVYTIGKFLGVDFQPWQAVNLAKDIANVMVFVGPLLAAASLWMDVQAIEKEKEREQELADARRNITSQFVKIAKDIEGKIDAQLRMIEEQIYGTIEKQIAEARKQQEAAIAVSNNWMKEIIVVRQDFEMILNEISLALEKPTP